MMQSLSYINLVSLKFFQKPAVDLSPMKHMVCMLATFSLEMLTNSIYILRESITEALRVHAN